MSQTWLPPEEYAETSPKATVSGAVGPAERSLVTATDPGMHEFGSGIPLRPRPTS